MDLEVIKLPSFVKSITGDVESDYWKPQNIDEWTDVQKTTAYLQVWTRQQQQERSLRKSIAIWVFSLISLQVAGVFALVLLDALKLLLINNGIAKLLIPSVLTEVFGMGFIVVKYLFKQSNIVPLNFFKQR